MKNTWPNANGNIPFSNKKMFQDSNMEIGLVFVSLKNSAKSFFLNTFVIFGKSRLIK